jgi:aspartate kinase
MKVYKFGGASVKDANGVRNLAKIIKNHNKLVVVVSAMGKTTNMLEKVTENYFFNGSATIQELKDFHCNISKDLFDSNHSIFDEINNLFVEIEWAIEDSPTSTYSFEYDQIVSVGELLSTKIVGAFLKQEGLNVKWKDARDLIRTDNCYRNARVDWSLTKDLISNDFTDDCIYLTQGFIGCTSENFTTTLGREGSDFSAAILAYALNAEEVVIWKDVPGFLNADPTYFNKTELLERIPYSEAIELAYFGAKVVHPRTIQPLKAKSIPLKVKSFLEPDSLGTEIGNFKEIIPFVPSFIVNPNQMLLSLSTKDLSFIIEEHISHIFSLFAQNNIAVNMMQNSALSFSVCFDNDPIKTKPLIEKLSQSYSLFYNTDLTLYTIRHYNSESVNKVKSDKEVLLEQKSRNNIQIVVKD